MLFSLLLGGVTRPSYLSYFLKIFRIDRFFSRDFKSKHQIFHSLSYTLIKGSHSKFRPCLKLLIYLGHLIFSHKSPIAGVPIIISCAAIRPPTRRFIRDWVATARNESDNIERTISFSAEGNTSIIRSTVKAAEAVCNAANTKFPV
jgi:hypothetical protein